MRPSPTSLYGLIIQAPLMSRFIASYTRAGVFCCLKADLSSSPHIPVEGESLITLKPNRRHSRLTSQDRSATTAGVNFPLCTIAHTPRLPEHCIEFVRILLWPKEEPFGAGVAIDGDDPNHIKWILEKSQERASQYNISGVNYRLTQGVVKRIMPAVASTNAVISAVCATEVFKLATSCCLPLNNYMNFNDTKGVYTYTFEAEKSEGCLACSDRPQVLNFTETDKLQDIINHLQENATYQMKSPGVTTSMDGKNKTLYMQTVKSIEEKTRENLKKSLKELGLMDKQELYVADVTTPNTLTFQLQLGTKMENS
ncbi:NEDD8-activating enzyme E1 catalytic subunit [Biomphalaria glabrata]|nr:NEDD8-activating enzyme E1 catalytic subunit-like [Biomphalaria glabrata]